MTGLTGATGTTGVGLEAKHKQIISYFTQNNTIFKELFHSSPCLLRSIAYMKKSQDYLQLHQRNQSKKRLTLVPVLVEAGTLQRISLNSSASVAPQRQDAAVCIPPSAASLEHSVPSTHTET